MATIKIFEKNKGVEVIGPEINAKALSHPLGEEAYIDYKGIMVKLPTGGSLEGGSFTKNLDFYKSRQRKLS